MRKNIRGNGKMLKRWGEGGLEPSANYDIT